MVQKFRSFLLEEASKPKEIIAYGSIGSREDIDHQSDDNSHHKPVTAYGSIGNRSDIGSNTEHTVAYGPIGDRPDIADKSPHNEIQVTSSGIKFHLKEKFDPKVTGHDLLQDMNTKKFLVGTEQFPTKINKRPHHEKYLAKAEKAVGHHHNINHETMFEGGGADPFHHPELDGSSNRDADNLAHHLKSAKSLKNLFHRAANLDKDDLNLSEKIAVRHLNTIKKKDPAKYKAYTQRTDKQIKVGEGVHNYTEGSSSVNEYLFKNHKSKKFLKPGHMRLKSGEHTVAAMDNVTKDKRNAAKSNFTVFSGMNHTIGEQVKNAKEGSVVHFPAYTSTSTDFAIAHQFGASKAEDTNDVEYKPNKFRKEHHGHVAVFHLPKGFDKGRYVNKHSNYNHEKEYVMARGLKFRKVKSEHIVHNRMKGDPWVGEDQLEAHTHIHHFEPV